MTRTTTAWHSTDRARTDPWLATGRNWPDGGVLLLVEGSTWRLAVPVENWLLRGGEDWVQRGVVVGGPAAISPATRTSLENAMTPPH